MSLPVYQNYNLKSASLEELSTLLTAELNLKHPVVLNVKNLDIDQQREVIGLIENWYVSNGVSFKFPYPICVLSDHEPSITNIPLFGRSEDLPKFYTQKEGKMNVKESHLVGRNRLLQQEVRNCDTAANETEMKVFGGIHRRIAECEEERLFYRSLLNKLSKAK